VSNRRKITVADSETDPFKYGRIPEPFLWGFYDGETFEHFATTAAFMEYLERRDDEIICYVHNGGKFDFFFLAEYLEELEPLTVINGRLTKFRIGNVEFRDSFTILPVPLAEHDKGTIDYKWFESDRRAEHMPAIIDYLYRDCVSLYQFVMRYLDEFGLNLTLASGALTCWAKLTGIPKPETSQDYYQTFAPFYYGGRVECFQSGMIERPFTVADINSAYPYAMTYRHPWGALYDDHSCKIPDDEETCKRSFIRLRARSYGAFPYRTEKGALTFPNDGEVREFFITGWEYIAALETASLWLMQVLQVYTFIETIEFNSYVSHFYAQKALAKESGDKAGYTLAKLHLTNLYGKFGANPAEYEEFKTCHPQFITALHETEGYDFAEMFGPLAILSRPISNERMRFYNVATAASVTGFVRAYLWRSLCACDGLIYCDTDSIAAENIGNQPIGADLGEWEIEARCDRGAVGGKKLYAFHNAESGDWKVSSKGVRLSAAEICQIAQGETITYKRDAPTFSIKSGAHFIARDVKMTDTAHS
jgi:hypothetical protein